MARLCTQDVKVFAGTGELELFGIKAQNIGMQAALS